MLRKIRTIVGRGAERLLEHPSWHRAPTRHCSTIKNPNASKDEPKPIFRRLYGQPTASTHPHLMSEGEVVPGIRLEEFHARRRDLVERLVSQAFVKTSSKEHLLIIPSASKVYMTDKIPYVFRQNTDFLYFTGCQEPDSVLVITVVDQTFGTTLFVRPRDEHSELWDGPRTGVEAATEMFGVDRSLPTKDFESFVQSFLGERKQATVWYESSSVLQPELHRKLRDVAKYHNGLAFVSPTRLFHQARLIKSPSEIRLMQRSCDIASEAIVETIRFSRPGVTEHQLFATVDYQCRMRGADFLAYPPVVASGNNANVIHYVTNNQMVREGDMVLMDAGCEYRGYSSDVTRTWPIGGSFTREQRLLYEIVLEIQTVLIQGLKEMPTLDELFREMCTLLGKSLQDVGLIPGRLKGDGLRQAAYSYCPHHVSHYLGMDVHDTGNVSRDIRVRPGMIVTIEPGIYVSPKNQLAPPEFHGLGIRVEDDVLVTENGPVVLTKNCPKDVSQIEALASQNQ